MNNHHNELLDKGLDEVMADLTYIEPDVKAPYCEHPGCYAPATTEWSFGEVDEDGPCTYYTDRCDAHPETDPQYEPRNIEGIY